MFPKVTFVLCISIVVCIIWYKTVYELPSLPIFSLSSKFEKLWNRERVKIFDCDFSNPTTETCKNHSKAILSTLDEFLSSKHTDLQKVSTTLTLSSWAAMLSPICITRDGRIFTFSPLSVESIRMIPSSDAIADDNDIDCMRRSYWNHIQPYWKITENRTAAGISGKTVFIRGRTFVTEGNNGNIAHSIQHLACNMAAAIGAKPAPFDGTINWEGKYDNVISLIVTAIADAIALTQQPAPLARLDWLVPNGFMCFEHLSIQRPNACGGHGLSRRHPSQNETMKLIRSVLFERLNLSRKSIPISRHTRSPCIRQIVVYTRNNTGRRRLLNADAIKTSLAANKCFNVTRLDKWPTSASEQAHMVNSADAFIMPHGAAIYTSLFLPDFAWLIEIGKNTWIAGGLIPVLPFSYHYINFGLDIVPKEANIDLYASDPSERSFTVNRTTIDYIRSIVEPHACEC